VCVRACRWCGWSSKSDPFKWISTRQFPEVHPDKHSLQKSPNQKTTKFVKVHSNLFLLSDSYVPQQAKIKTKWPYMDFSKRSTTFLYPLMLGKCNPSRSCVRTLARLAQGPPGRPKKDQHYLSYLESQAQIPSGFRMSRGEIAKLCLGDPNDPAILVSLNP